MRSERALSIILVTSATFSLTLTCSGGTVDPNSLEARAEPFRRANQVLQAHFRQSHTADERERYLREVVPLLTTNISAAREVVDYCKAVKDGRKPKTRPDWEYSSMLSQAIDVFRYPPVVAQDLGYREDTIELLQRLRAELATLAPAFLEAAQIDPSFIYPQMVFLQMDRGYWWAASPQQYLDDLKKWLEFAMSKDPLTWSRAFSAGKWFEFGACPLWPDREDNARRFLAFQDELLRDSRPLMRGRAHLSLACYYATVDGAKSLEHYKAFIETFVNEIIPTAPEWGQQIAFEDLNLPEPLRQAAGLRYITLSHARIILKVLECCPTFHMGTWRDPVLSCYQDLERIGETQQAVALLAACRMKLRTLPPLESRHIETINSWLRDLKQKHPDLAIDVALIPTRECLPQVMVRASDVSDALEKQGMPPASSAFRRLLIDENKMAIVCVWDLAGQAQCGIVRLDPNTLAVQSCRGYSVPVRLSLTNNANLQSWYPEVGPASTISGDTVCVAFPNGGIVVFDGDGVPAFFNSENGLPSNMGKAMAILGGRLYAVTGWLEANGLIEFDLKTHRANELISSKAGQRGNPLDGSRIHDVATDRRANRLWLSAEPPQSGGQSRVYYLDPNDPNAVRTAPIPNSSYITFHQQGRFLSILGDTELRTIDLATGRIVWATLHGSWDSSVDTGAAWQTNMYLSTKFAGNGRNLVVTARDQGGAMHTIWFSAGQRNPVEVSGSTFPSVQEIKDMGRTHKGLLILTPGSLSLVPGTAED